MTAWKLPLINELRKRELLRNEMARLMGANASTLERRIKCMGKVLVRRHDGVHRQVFYRLTDNQALVDAFLAAEMPRENATRGAIERAKADATRHVHILADDEAFVPKMHRGLPQRDALVAAFFGPPAGYL